MDLNRALRLLLQPLYLRLLMSDTIYRHVIAIACPPANKAAVINLLALALARPASEINLTLPVSANGAMPAKYLMSNGAYTDAERDALKPLFAPGGPAELLGARARRMINSATETTSGEPDKVQVTVVLLGQPIPLLSDWSETRVSRERFFEELGATEIFSPI